MFVILRYLFIFPRIFRSQHKSTIIPAYRETKVNIVIGDDGLSIAYVACGVRKGSTSGVFNPRLSRTENFKCQCLKVALARYEAPCSITVVLKLVNIARYYGAQWVFRVAHSCGFPLRWRYCVIIGGLADVISGSRSRRPCHDNGRISKNHYHQSANEPADLHVVNEWEEKYHDLHEIWVNGTITRQWSRGRGELQQVTARCKDIVGKESLRHKYFAEYFFGANSYLYGMHWRPLE